MRIFLTNYIFISMIILSMVLWIFKVPYRPRIIILSIYSLVILATLNPVFIMLMMLVVLLIYLLFNAQKSKRIKPAAFMGIGLTVTLLFLLLGKYGPTLIDSLFNTNSVLGFNLLVPIGISYFAMKVIQLILNIRRGLIEEIDFFEMLSFLVFLPTFAAGPLESYTTFKQGYITDFGKDDVLYAVKRILLGFFKKLFITEVILGAYLIPAYHHNQFIFGTPWLAPFKPSILVILVFVMSFFDLSSYSDIAIGFGRLFGFKICENFNRPFWKRNIGDFWRSWHMSLSRWCTTNVYFPVFGATKKVWIGLYASMITMGMWHYVNGVWLFWALHHATGLVYFNAFTRLKRKNKKLKAFFDKKIVVFISHLLTFYYVSLGFAFVSAGSLKLGLTRYVMAVSGLFEGVYGIVKLAIDAIF